MIPQTLKRLPALYCIIIVSVLYGCAGHRHNQHGGIIVDTKGVDMHAYHQDLHECRNFAQQVPTAQKAATKAAGGAIVGGAIGAIVGNSDHAAKGAGVGAVVGAAKGVRQGRWEKQRVVKRCLRGRGYKVLN